MIIQDFIHRLNEKSRPAPNWSDTKGVYANLSDPSNIEYYVKCPKCSEVHGNYKTMREAHSKRLCQNCNLKAIDKTKKMVQDVDSYKNRGKPGKGLSHVFNEADEMLPPPPPPEEEEEFDPREYTLTTPGYEDWIGAAVQELNVETGYDFVLVNRFRDAADKPSDFVHVDVEDGSIEYSIYKTEEDAEATALEQVRQQLRDEPELFSQSFIQSHIDTERLKRVLSDEARDISWLSDDYESVVDELIRPGVLNHEDVYTDDGDLMEMTPEIEDLIDRAKEALADQREEAFDPMDWLEDIYGKEDAVKQAIELAGIDIEAAADEAVRMDGWVHYLNTYDNNYITLDSGAVAFRLS